MQTPITDCCNRCIVDIRANEGTTRACWIECPLDRSTLGINYGRINTRTFVAITSSGSQVILRGACADTYAEALESFVDMVLDTGRT
jgi:hypothetical protein